MAGIRALTGIEEGAAQVFDLSPMIEEQKAEKAKNEEKLIASMLEYDPNDVWQRDLGKVSQEVDKYESWVMENYDRLNSNGKDRIVAWSEKKNLENGIRNTIAYSKKAGSEMQQLAALIKDDPDYDTAENRALIYQFSQTPSEELYSNREAFNTLGVQDQFSRAVNIPLDSMIENISNSFYSAKKMRATGNEYLDTKRGVIDESGLNSYIDKIWNEGDVSQKNVTAAKIQGKFKTKENLKEALTSRVPKDVEMSFYNPRTGSTTGKANKESIIVPKGESKIEVGSFSDSEIEVPTIRKATGIFGWGSGEDMDVTNEEDIQVETYQKIGEGGASEQGEREYVLNAKGEKVYVSRQTRTVPNTKTTYNLDTGTKIEVYPLAFKITGSIPGFNTIGGEYNASLFETSTGGTITSIVEANYAVKDVTVRYQSNYKGKTVNSKKRIKAGEIIPENAQLFVDNEGRTAVKDEDRFQYVGTDLFANIESSNIIMREGEDGGDYAESIIQSTGNQSKTKGMVKYSTIAGMIPNAFSKYPKFNEQITALKTKVSRESALNQAKANAKKAENN